MFERVGCLNLPYKACPNSSMSDPMDRAFEHKRQHPNASYEVVAAHGNVPKTNFYERWNGIHAAPGVNAHRCQGAYYDQPEAHRSA